MTPQVMTANRLLDGEVVFLGRAWLGRDDRPRHRRRHGRAGQGPGRAGQAGDGGERGRGRLPDRGGRPGRAAAPAQAARVSAHASARRCAPTWASRRGARGIAMYRYDEFDRQFVLQRTAQFADQVQRRLAGELSEDEFKPLRLKNGLYLQLHAYMLRIAIPYGTLSSRQLRKLADIAETYDRGYGHFTTRQNLQLNWPELKDVPAILGELAEVEMHAIQTSGNCIRNVTSDHYAGVAADEVADPRPWAELLRQWSTLHPEFSYLPRKFKIAVTGAAADRAAVRAHDIGLILKKNDAGEIGFEILVGGGLGRTPMIGKTVRDFLPADELLRLLHGDHARLQPLRPPGQQVQGAGEDPGPRAGAGRVQARGRDRVRGRRPCRGHRPGGRRARAHPGATSPRRPTRSCPTATPCTTSASWRCRNSRAGRARTRRATRCRATPSSTSRSSRSAASRAMRPPSRCAPWPPSPTSSATARSASPTSRTWSCPTSRRATCSRCGTCSRMPASPPPTAT